MKEKRTTGILLVTLWLLAWTSGAQAIPPDPSNAALLYYQAMLIHHEPNEAISSVYQEFVDGKTGPTEEIRQYVQGSHAALDYAILAAKVQDCDWGLAYSKGFSLLLSHLSHFRSLSKLIVADARVLAAQGDCKAALNRCFVLQRMADHLGDDTLISYLVGLAVRDLQYTCMKDVIGQASSDPALLRWLRSEMAKLPAREISAVRPLKIEIEIVTDLMRMDHLKELVQALGGGADQKTIEEAAARANEQILGQAKRMYTEHMDKMLEAWSAPLPYGEVYSRLEQLKSISDPNDPVSALVGAFAPAMSRVYNSKTRIEAYANAVRAGIEICLRRSESGKLPTALPAGLPKDPFSGQDFEYERTDNGFMLRCRAKDLDKDTVHEYAFTLK